MELVAQQKGWCSVGLFDFLRSKDKAESIERISEGINSILSLPEINRNLEIAFPSFYLVAQHKETEEEKNNTYTAYFKNGVLFDISPKGDINLTLDENRQIAYDARFIVSDNIKYDLFNPDDLSRLHVPTYIKRTDAFPHIIRDLAHILNMRAKKTFCSELAVPLVYKVISMMIRSGWGQKKDYERLITQLEGLDEKEHVQYLRAELTQYLPFMTDNDYYSKLAFKNALIRANQINTDLMEMPYLGCSCGECSKYQGRIYSISGKDKRFPSIPNQVFRYGGIHSGCHHSFFPVLLFDNTKITKTVIDCNGIQHSEDYDAVSHSNRPFVDERSPKEKEFYQIQKTKETQESASWNREELIKYIKRGAEYYWIQQYLPNLAPKSLGAYTRMKHSQSSKYLTIKSMAKSLSMDLNDSL